MSVDKKGFWARLFGPGKPSACCSVKIEEDTGDVAESTGSAGPQAAPPPRQGDEPDDSPCCCGGVVKRPRDGGGSCCG